MGAGGVALGQGGQGGMAVLRPAAGGVVPPDADPAEMGAEVGGLPVVEVEFLPQPEGLLQHPGDERLGDGPVPEDPVPLPVVEHRPVRGQEGPRELHVLFRVKAQPDHPDPRLPEPPDRLPVLLPDLLPRAQEAPVQVQEYRLQPGARAVVHGFLLCCRGGGLTSAPPPSRRPPLPRTSRGGRTSRSSASAGGPGPPPGGRRCPCRG